MWSEHHTAASFLGVFRLLGWFDVFFACLFHYSTCSQVSSQWCLGTQWFLRSLLLALLLPLLYWISLNRRWPVFVHFNLSVALNTLHLVLLWHLFNFIVVTDYDLHIFHVHPFVVKRWEDHAAWFLLLYFLDAGLKLYWREQSSVLFPCKETPTIHNRVFHGEECSQVVALCGDNNRVVLVPHDLVVLLTLKFHFIRLKRVKFRQLAKFRLFCLI